MHCEFSQPSRVAAFQFLGNMPWLAAALAVSIAIALMHLTKTLHPPGGATALIAVIGGDAVHSLGYLYVMLIDLLKIPENAFVTVEDGETLSLGDKTMKFIHTPWVHWPETMVPYLEEDHILFSCDFYGSHIATTDIFVTDQGRVYEAAKRYFAEIMMPFRNVITKNTKE